MCVNVCMSVFSALIFIITSLLPLHYVCFFLLGKAGIENISNFRIQEFNAIHFSLSIAFAASCKFFCIFLFIWYKYLLLLLTNFFGSMCCPYLSFVDFWFNCTVVRKYMLYTSITFNLNKITLVSVQIHLKK